MLKALLNILVALAVNNDRLHCLCYLLSEAFLIKKKKILMFLDPIFM